MNDTTETPLVTSGRCARRDFFQLAGSVRRGASPPCSRALPARGATPPRSTDKTTEIIFMSATKLAEL